jgi:mannose-6-phosphate isomerase
VGSQDLYPLIFEPVFKQYIWGGQKLRTQYGRQQAPPGPIAESWEIAAHPNGVSKVTNGSLAGTALVELYEEYGLELIGEYGLWAHQRRRFPLLVKLLDAERPLSVQVHPRDSLATESAPGELGKTEMWWVLEADEDAHIALGTAEGVDLATFQRAVEGAAIESVLQRLRVKAGDIVCIPSGTLHALLGGVVLAEIQQNSDITYRIYDWGRDRELHLQQALKAIDFEHQVVALPEPIRLPFSEGIREGLCLNPYFAVERIYLRRGRRWLGEMDGRSFEIWGTIEGLSRITSHTGSVRLPAVHFALLPANLGQVVVECDEDCVLLRCYLTPPIGEGEYWP